MEKKDHRRQHKRYPVRWKAGVVFDKATGKPTLHTQTQDLSPGGAAIVSTYEDLTGTSLTLLFAHPPKPGEQPKMIKVRAHVVSTTQRQGKSDYRHGLKFVRAADDGLDALEEILKAEAPEAAAASPAPVAAAPSPAAAPAPESVPASAAGASGRLAALRQQAQAKLNEPVIDPKAEERKRIEVSLDCAYKYFKELVDQLNVLNPAFAKSYVIAGVPEFSGLTWHSGQADLRKRELTPDRKEWESVSLYYKISGNKQLRVVRDYPISEKVGRALTECKLEFTTSEKRNARGSLESVAFILACDVSASLLLTANYETGKLQMRMRNVEHFGFSEREILPQAINEASLEELTGFILGETTRLGPLILQGA